MTMTRRSLIQRAMAAAVAAVAVDKLDVLASLRARMHASAAERIEAPAVRQTVHLAHDFTGPRFSFLGHDKGQPIHLVEFDESPEGQMVVLVDRILTDAELAGLPDALSREEVLYAREVLADELARVARL